jgi:hypothetical protein
VTALLVTSASSASISARLQRPISFRSGKLLIKTEAARIDACV